jgi:hypothetical protein
MIANMDSSNRNKSKQTKGLFGRGMDFTRRAVEKAQGKGKYREEINDGFVLEREGEFGAMYSIA